MLATILLASLLARVEIPWELWDQQTNWYFGGTLLC